MYAKNKSYTGSGTASVSIVSSNVPDVMPLISDNIDNMLPGYRLAPGSTIYVTTTGDLYMLGENDDWTLQ